MDNETVHLTNLRIQQFKGLTDVVFESFGSINAIVGKNNSGKSTVLHAIDMVGLALHLGNWNDFQPKLEIKDLFGDVGTFAIDVGYSNGTELHITANPGYGPTINPAATEEQKFSTILILPDTGVGLLTRRHKTPRSVMDQVQSRNYTNLNALEILFAIKFYSSRNERGLTPASYESLIDQVKEYFPDIENVTSNRTDQDIATLTYREYGKELDILYSGTGLKHFLDVLIKTTISNAGIVLLDEPELGLHPDLQRKFLEYLIQLSERKGIQIFMATHSQVLLNFADEVTYYRVVNTLGKRTANRVDGASLHMLLSDLGIRPSDVFNNDVCIFVEGATDVIFIEHIVRILYKDELSGLAIGVVQYGGSAAEAIVSGAIHVANLSPAQSHCLWIRDRDAKPTDFPSSEATKFTNKLESQGQTTKIWDRREIEYYFPDEVLRAAQQHPIDPKIVLGIKHGDQATKFRTATQDQGAVSPRGKFLRDLLRTYMTNKEQVPTEIIELLDAYILKWKKQILGDP